MKIEYSIKFHKQYYKLHSEIQKLADIKINLFTNDPFNPQLKTHKLHGNLSNFWSFSINYEYRVIVCFIGKNHVIFRNIGRHDIYY